MINFDVSLRVKPTLLTNEHLDDRVLLKLGMRRRVKMGRPLRIEYPDAHYHVTSRGNERKDVFKSQKDREQFLSYLESAVSRYDAVIHAYCLMNNHYHLLLETPSGNLSKIM